MSVINREDAFTKYKMQIRNCRNRKDRNGNAIEMRLSFDEWLHIWEKSGMWHLRAPNGAVMSRHNDIGHYELGNVDIKMSADNIREANTGRIASKKQRETSRLIGKKRLGQRDSENTKLKKSKSREGLRWWTDGVITVQSRECPSGFQSGRNFRLGQGLKWWTNGAVEIKSTTCPIGYKPGRKPKAEKTCPHCGFVGRGGIMLRWHFDNCKHK